MTIDAALPEYVTLVCTEDGKEFLVPKSILIQPQLSEFNQILSSLFAKSFREGAQKRAEIPDYSSRAIEKTLRILAENDRHRSLSVTYIPNIDIIEDFNEAAEMYSFSQRYINLPVLVQCICRYARQYFQSIDNDSLQITKKRVFQDYHLLKITPNERAGTLLEWHQREFFTDLLLLKACEDKDGPAIHELLMTVDLNKSQPNFGQRLLKSKDLWKVAEISEDPEFIGMLFKGSSSVIGSSEHDPIAMVSSTSSIELLAYAYGNTTSTGFRYHITSEEFLDNCDYVLHFIKCNARRGMITPYFAWISYLQENLEKQFSFFNFDLFVNYESYSEIPENLQEFAKRIKKEPQLERAFSAMLRCINIDSKDSTDSDKRNLRKQYIKSLHALSRLENKRTTENSWTPEERDKQEKRRLAEFNKIKISFQWELTKKSNEALWQGLVENGHVDLLISFLEAEGKIEIKYLSDNKHLFLRSLKSKKFTDYLENKGKDLSRMMDFLKDMLERLPKHKDLQPISCIIYEAASYFIRVLLKKNDNEGAQQIQELVLGKKLLPPSEDYIPLEVIIQFFQIKELLLQNDYLNAVKLWRLLCYDGVKDRNNRVFFASHLFKELITDNAWNNGFQFVQLFSFKRQMKYFITLLTKMSEESLIDESIGLIFKNESWLIQVIQKQTKKNTHSEYLPFEFNDCLSIVLKSLLKNKSLDRNKHSVLIDRFKKEYSFQKDQSLPQEMISNGLEDIVFSLVNEMNYEQLPDTYYREIWWNAYLSSGVKLHGIAWLLETLKSQLSGLISSYSTLKSKYICLASTIDQILHSATINKEDLNALTGFLIPFLSELSRINHSEPSVNDGLLIIYRLAQVHARCNDFKRASELVKLLNWDKIQDHGCSTIIFGITLHCKYILFKKNQNMNEFPSCPISTGDLSNDREFQTLISSFSSIEEILKFFTAIIDDKEIHNRIEILKCAILLLIDQKRLKLAEDLVDSLKGYDRVQHYLYKKIAEAKFL